MKLSLFITLALTLAASARPLRPLRRQNDFDLQNGQDAIALNEQFKSAKEGDACQSGDSCVGDRFAQCVGGRLVSQACAPGTVCAALPLVNSRGTSIACTTAADVAARIQATGAQAGASPAAPEAPAEEPAEEPPAPEAPPANDGTNNAGSGGAAQDDEDPQKSLTLLPSVIGANFAKDGQDEPEVGQVPSLTSTNNFINFCATLPDLPITNGEQIETGSCNPIPIGAIPSVDNMPSSKFQFPANGDTIPANEAFTIRMQIKNLITGNFVNAKKSYFAAPQQLQNGVIKGHSHVVVETMVDGNKQTEATNPRQFAFFKGLNGAAESGVLTAEVTKGLPPATYRLCSINAAANHQPVIVPVAQHGSLDDCVYFTTE